MVASIVVAIGNVFLNLPQEGKSQFTLINVVILLNYFLLFFRLFLGDSNYNDLCAEISLNNKPNSPHWILKNKLFIDTTFLLFQGVLFVFLAYLIYDPKNFYILYLIILSSNIAWLSVQQKSLKLFLNCVARKANDNSPGYTKKKLLHSYFNINALDEILEVWLVNNICFLIIGLIIFSFYQNSSENVLFSGYILFMISSLLDLFKTFRMYANPKTLLKFKPN